MTAWIGVLYNRNRSYVISLEPTINDWNVYNGCSKSSDFYLVALSKKHFWEAYYVPFKITIFYYENDANISLLYCLFNSHSILYSCPMKKHHSSDAHSCGLSKAVQNCVIYIYYLGQMKSFLHKNFISSDSVNTWSNVRRQIVLIAFWEYTKRPQNLVKCFLFASRSTVISPHFWKLWRNT